MRTKHLSSVATDVIQAYGITATNVINTYRYGGERIIGLVDEGFASAVNRGAAALRKDLRSNLIGRQQRVSGYTVKGVQAGAERAQGVVGVVVDLATKGVSVIAENAVRLDHTVKLNALDTINRVAMPAAQVVSQVADRIEEGSSFLVRRVAGKAMPAKAIATRKLNAAQREAAVARKRVTRGATSRVRKAVAETATETSNAARRVARKARSTNGRVGKAVAETATGTSNAARRVARKAKATASAA